MRHNVDDHPVLRVTDASAGYRGSAVLTGVALDLSAGEAMALVGPNGAGKTTLIKACLGLADVTAGTVSVLGSTPREGRRRCAYVPQIEALDAEFPVSVAQVVLMGRYRGLGWVRPTGRADRRAAADALDAVGLGDQARTRFGALSGGQRQRVLLARAIAAQPALMLLDEPLNGVDALNQAAILATLRGLRAAGVAMMISTHDLAMVRSECDSACLLNGRQVAVGAVASTLTPDLLRQTYGGSAVMTADDAVLLVEP